jgi:hypothetical protein
VLQLVACQDVDSQELLRNLQMSYKEEMSAF